MTPFDLFSVPLVQQHNSGVTARAATPQFKTLVRLQAEDAGVMETRNALG